MTLTDFFQAFGMFAFAVCCGLLIAWVETR